MISEAHRQWIQEGILMSVKRIWRRNILYILLNWKEYMRRLARTARYAVLFLCVISLIVGATVLAIASLSNNMGTGNIVKSAASTAAGAAYPIQIDENGVYTYMPQTDESDNALSRPDELEASERFEWGIFVFCLVEALVVSLVGMIFSGAYAKVFLSPINPIKFAPYAILGDDALSFRFWICYPSGRYLYDVDVTLGYRYNQQYEHSTLTLEASDLAGLMDTQGGCSGSDGRRDGAEQGACHKEGSLNGFNSVEVKRCPQLMGVWNVDVPLDSPAARYLLKEFEDHADANPVIRLSVQGRTESGEIVGKEARYNRLRILDGFRFAAYHYPRDPSGHGLIPLKDRRANAHMWFSRFCKVIADPECASSGIKGEVPAQNESGTMLRRAWAAILNGEWRRLEEAKPEVHQKQLDQLRMFECMVPALWDARLTWQDLKLLNHLDRYI